MMNKLIVVSATAVTLFAAVGTAGAQSMNGRWDRPMTDRNVSMQNDGMWTEPTGSGSWRTGTSGTTYESRAFKSQEILPQSPPGGGF